jgi:hypothetical protein
MFHPRVVRRAVAAAGPLLAALLCLPTDLEARRAPSPTKDLPSDLALVPGDCVAFFTLRYNDLRNDPLVAALLVLGEAPFLQERVIRVAPDQVERVTLLVVGDAEAAIVRTRKPYDATALFGKLAPGIEDRRPILKSGDGKKEPEGPTFVKKEINGKTIAYVGYPGRPSRWTEGVCQVDRNVFVAGRLPALEHLLRVKSKPSEELSSALGRAGKHTLVGCIQGEPLRAMLTGEEARAGGKDDRKPGKESVEGEKKATEADSKRKDPYVPAQMLPYKPLLLGRTALLTADVSPSLKATLRITFADKAELEAAETALKTTLYVGGEVVGYARRVPSLKLLRAPAEKARQAIRSAPVERTETSLRTTVSLKVDEAMRKLVGQALISSAQRTRGINNLKQMALALHNYNDTYGHLPPPASTDAKGNALLSWRVAILPFIDESDLYKQFKLDEPWDSPHNKKLLAKMPKVYAPVGVKTKEADSTFYQLCTGPNTPWPTISTKARIPANFPDGTSNTLLIVEAGEAVPWTKPTDLAIDPKKPLPALGAQVPEVFLAAMGDGSVRSFRRDLGEKLLRLLIDPADGQPIPWDKIDGKR